MRLGNKAFFSGERYRAQLGDQRHHLLGPVYELTRAYSAVTQHASSLALCGFPFEKSEQARRSWLRFRAV